MTRFVRSPRWHFVLSPRWLVWHLLLVVVLVSFTMLGRWQVAAFTHDDPPARTTVRPTVALDRVSSPGGRLGADDLGRRVSAPGSYERDATLLVPGRARPGGGPLGWWVLTPLRTATGVLPVVRGWVPDRSAPAVTAPAGPLTVTGLLAASESGAPPDVPAAGNGEIPYVATVTVLDALPYRPGELYDGWLAARREAPAPQAAPRPVGLPAPATDEGVGRWRNLGYGLQWWLFAGAAVFLWWTVLRRAVREQQEREREPDETRPPLVAPRRTT